MGNYSWKPLTGRKNNPGPWRAAEWAMLNTEWEVMP